MGRHRQFDLEDTLDAALSVFWAKGYEGASYDDLSRATGVARPGLYSAFGNKEALFRLALDRYGAKYLRFIDEAMKQSRSRDVVRVFLEGTVNVATLIPDSPGCLGVNGALACSADGDPIRRELIARREETEDKLRRRLERAKAEGDLPASADCGVLAGYITTVSQGLAVQAKAGVSRDRLLALVRHSLDTWPS